MDTNIFRSLDNDRININEYFEVEFWAREFSLQPEVFKDLVKKAGTNSAEALRTYLGKSYEGKAA